MKKSSALLTFLLLVLLTFSGCGGGGGSNASPSPTEDPVDPNAPIPASGTVTPIERDFYHELLVNPGKGWIIYGNDNSTNAFVDQNSDTWNASSVGYLRYDWSTLEPTEGDYRWQYIDNALAACRSHGKKLAFGVMGLNSSVAKEYVTPQYVFKAGAQYTTGTSRDIPGQRMIVPVWTNTIYLTKLEKFLKALATRYDGNPNIAFMDIRGYGNWGENHVYLFDGNSTPLNADQYQSLYLAMYRRIFPNTLLVSANSLPELDPAFEWGIQNGIAGRNDGAIYDRNVAYFLQKYQNKLPAILEFWGSYQKMRDMGRWQDDYVRQDIENASASYVSMGQYGGAAEMYRQKKNVIIYNGNLMGYYFVLNQAVYDSQGIGQAANLSLKWTNKGVAPIFIPAYVAIALLDPTTGAVVEKKWLDDIVPGHWYPGQTVTENTSFSFNPHESQYRLAIGLFTSKDRNNPNIKLGIMGKNAQGWYVLSNMPHSN